ncbi:hypothetical protein ACFOHY_15120 [Rhizobium rosettiformans]
MRKRPTILPHDRSSVVVDRSGPSGLSFVPGEYRAEPVAGLHA